MQKSQINALVVLKLYFLLRWIELKSKWSYISFSITQNYTFQNFTFEIRHTKSKPWNSKKQSTKTIILDFFCFKVILALKLENYIIQNKHRKPQKKHDWQYHTGKFDNLHFLQLSGSLNFMNDICQKFLHTK